MAWDHYVPQVYLRNFIISKDDERVKVINKKSGSIYKTGTNAICAIENGNRSSFFKDGDKNTLENILKDIEPSLPSVFDRVVNKEIDEETLELLSFLVAYLYCVNPKNRNKCEFINKYALDHLVECIPDFRVNSVPSVIAENKTIYECIKDGTIFVDIDKEYPLAFSVAHIYHLHKLFMNSGYWIFYYLDNKKLTLFTCDNPIICDYWQESRSSCFSISIAPHIMLKIKVNIDIIDKSDIIKVPPFQIKKADKYLVKSYNRKVIKNAHNSIIINNNSINYVQSEFARYKNFNDELTSVSYGPLTCFQQALNKWK